MPTKFHTLMLASMFATTLGSCNDDTQQPALVFKDIGVDERTLSFTVPPGTAGV